MVIVSIQQSIGSSNVRIIADSPLTLNSPVNSLNAVLAIAILKAPFGNEILNWPFLSESSFQLWLFLSIKIEASSIPTPARSVTVAVKSVAATVWRANSGNPIKTAIKKSLANDFIFSTSVSENDKRHRANFSPRTNQSFEVILHARCRWKLFENKMLTVLGPKHCGRPIVRRPPEYRVRVVGARMCECLLIPGSHGKFQLVPALKDDKAKAQPDCAGLDLPWHVDHNDSAG